MRRTCRRRRRRARWCCVMSSWGCRCAEPCRHLGVPCRDRRCGHPRRGHRWHRRCRRDRRGCRIAEDGDLAADLCDQGDLRLLRSPCHRVPNHGCDEPSDRCTREAAQVAPQLIAEVAPVREGSVRLGRFERRHDRRRPVRIGERCCAVERDRRKGRIRVLDVREVLARRCMGLDACQVPAAR